MKRCMKIEDISFTARTMTVCRHLKIDTLEQMVNFDWTKVYNSTIGKEFPFFSGVKVSDRVLADIQDNINRIINSN